MSRVVVASMVIAAVSVGAGRASAQEETMRTRRPPVLETTLPTPHALGPNFDPRALRLVDRAYDLVVERKVTLAPRLQLTLVNVQSKSLLTMNLGGLALLTVTPTGFSSGEITLTAHFK